MNLDNIKAFNRFKLSFPRSSHFFFEKKTDVDFKESKWTEMEKEAMKTKKSIAFFAILANDFVENTKISCSKNV